jgi:5-(carboxyamino)imidazole ribonucleotide mutase
VAINGARNAALLAAQVLATADPAIAERLAALKQEMAEQVEAASSKLASKQ